MTKVRGELRVGTVENVENDDENAPAPTSTWTNKLTLPTTPVFATATRARLAQPM